MTTAEPAGTGSPAELNLGLRLVLHGAVTWSIARLGDPVARLLHAPWRRDPYPIYRQLRARGPLVRSRLGVWAASTYEVCDAVLRDRRFGVRTSDGSYGDPTTAAVGLQLSLLELDPPDHTRLRKLAAPAFRPRKLENYRQRIEDSAHELLDRALAKGEFDLIRDFASPLPIRVICELLGLPELGAERLAVHGAALSGALDGIRSIRHLRQMRASTLELNELFGDLIEQRRRQPGEDIVSDLVTALDQDKLDSAELVQMCDLLLVAGFETTVNLIGNGVLALLERPDQWRLLCDDPDLAVGVVEETLRWDPPVQTTMRIAHEPVEVAGRLLPRNSAVLPMLGAAGRDPAVHFAPDRFDITRGTRGDHLAFSSGIHYCLGAPLARLESEIAFRCLATRVPELRRSGALVRRPTSVIHGLSALPVAASKATAGGRR
ncbi:cytochrome P450 [Saccharopolyspora erythraea]|uniref:cytochrome P450 n=1 Tax=Saccharopolyspora erythraea TaxID=1836 RepID=UPI001BAAF204|nr:cytochrome P450 [Saccharopolyspora erythraea]QUH04426.1 cytochrome P450 [Saccharopolyspora erythraea]